MYLKYKKASCRHCRRRIGLGLRAFELARDIHRIGERHNRRGFEKRCRHCKKTSFYRPRTVMAWRVTTPIASMVLMSATALLWLEVLTQRTQFDSWWVSGPAAASLGLVGTFAFMVLSRRRAMIEG